MRGGRRQLERLGRPGSPAAVALGAGLTATREPRRTLEVFVPGTEGALWHAQLVPNGGWGSWQRIAPPPAVQTRERERPRGATRDGFAF